MRVTGVAHAFALSSGAIFHSCELVLFTAIVIPPRFVDKPRECVEKQRHYSAYKGPYSQGYGSSKWSHTDVRAGL